jgi:hypothetical protein
MADMDEYVEILFKRVLEGPITSAEWLEYYDNIFRLVSDPEVDVDRKSRGLYEAVEKRFKYYSSKLDKERYLSLIQTIHRLFSYLHRVWIPSKKLMPMFELGVEIWNSSESREDKILPASGEAIVKPREKKEVKKSMFTLRLVGDLIELIIATKPDWFRVGRDLMRDDIYEGCQKLAPVLMNDVDWKDFWELIEPVICCSEPGSMYIRVRQLF